MASTPAGLDSTTRAQNFSSVPPAAGGFHGDVAVLFEGARRRNPAGLIEVLDDADEDCDLLGIQGYYINKIKINQLPLNREAHHDGKILGEVLCRNQWGSRRNK